MTEEKKEVKFSEIAEEMGLKPADKIVTEHPVKTTVEIVEREPLPNEVYTKTLSVKVTRKINLGIYESIEISTGNWTDLPEYKIDNWNVDRITKRLLSDCNRFVVREAMQVIAQMLDIRRLQAQENSEGQADARSSGLMLKNVLLVLADSYPDIAAELPDDIFHYIEKIRGSADRA